MNFFKRFIHLEIKFNSQLNWLSSTTISNCLWESLENAPTDTTNGFPPANKLIQVSDALSIVSVRNEGWWRVFTYHSSEGFTTTPNILKIKREKHFFWIRAQLFFFFLLLLEIIFFFPETEWKIFTAREENLRNPYRRKISTLRATLHFIWPKGNLNMISKPLFAMNCWGAVVFFSLSRTLFVFFNQPNFAIFNNF